MSEDVTSNNHSPSHTTQHTHSSTLHSPNTSLLDAHSQNSELAPADTAVRRPWIHKTMESNSNNGHNNSSPPRLTTCSTPTHTDTPAFSTRTLPRLAVSTDGESASDSEGDSEDGASSPGNKSIIRDHCYSPATPSPSLKARPHRQDNTSLSAAIPAFRLAYAPAVPTTSLMLQRLLQLNPTRTLPPSPARTTMFTAARGQIPPRPLLNTSRPEIKRPNFYSQFQHRPSPTLTGGSRLFPRGGRGRGRGQIAALSHLAQKKKALKRKFTESPSGSTDTDEDTNLMLCRRSDRNIGKKQKYRYEVDLNLSDDGSEDEARRSKKTQVLDLPRPSEVYKRRPTLMLSSDDTLQQWSSDEEHVIDKVLATRTMDNEENEESEQFFVKFKGYSYLHAKWSTLSQLNQVDKRAMQKINRYRQKQQTGLSLLEEEPFNPDYIQVDRILDTERVRETNGTLSAYCLVKWCSLAYEDVTWELKQNIPDEDKFRQYEVINKPPLLSSLSHKPRPSSEVPVSATSKEYRNKNLLRGYQQVGVNWLMMKWFSRKNCILADEMGLGKTIQTIAFLNAVVEYGIKGPFLIIAPLSTIQNWYREFQNWTHMNAIVYHGTAASRRLIEAYEFYYKSFGEKRHCYKFNAVITTYEAVMIEGGELINVPWRVTVIDEAHRLKNTRAKLTSHLKSFEMEHKILLTGTPLQNSVEELWSLLNFLDPVRFDSDQEFLAKFGQLLTEEQVIDLQKVLKPMVLRRLKEDVEKSLAPKEETIIEVELTSIQKKYYRAIMERNFSFLMAKTPSRALPSVMNLFMELRKCCNHPFLIKGAESHITEEWQRFHPREESWQALVQASGKLVLVDKLLPKLREGQHKVLIFSQMVKCLDILEDYLIWQRYPYERIDGQVRGNLRQAAIDRFSKPGSDRFVFLLCTRAGGLGINLTAADTVIIYDSDWNPQNDLQAQARCHRIGQDKAVKVYRLITRNSYERQMFDKASMKLGLDKAVLQSVNNGQREPSGHLSKLEVEELLKRGAYGALLDEDDSSRFCDEDIEVILERRTQVVTIDTIGQKNSTFAKASFASSEGDSEISMDDPEFWQKWALKAEIDLAKLENNTEALILHEPRERKQTKRFESQDPSFDAAAMPSNSSSEVDEEETQPTETDPQCPLFRGVCMKIESALMTYGWGRWSMMLENTDLKLSFKPRDLELICRQILVFSLHHFRGDDKVKSTIHSLLLPDPSQSMCDSLTQFSREDHEQMLAQPPDTLFSDSAYKRHLQRVSGRVLQRVRVLYHIRGYLTAEKYERLMAGELSVEQFDAHIPEIDNVPVFWWDRTADKALILGTIKHGYENYSLISEDACLQFCSPSEERNGTNRQVSEGATELDESCMDTCEVEANNSHPAREWPSPAELNNRLKKIVTESDRNLKKTVLRSEKKALRDKKREKRQRARGSTQPVHSRSGWTHREEQSFSRAVYSHGVVFGPGTDSHNWSRVREAARLKKSDEEIEKFYKKYVSMCYSVSMGSPPTDGGVVPVSEGKARRFIKRLQLLSLIREVLADENIADRLQVSEGSDVPSWWRNPTHDLDLLRGVVKHGLTCSDLKIYSDTELSFSQTIPTTQQVAPPGKKLAQRLPPSWPSSRFILSRLNKLVHLAKNSFWPEYILPLPPIELDISVYGPYAVKSAPERDATASPIPRDSGELELVVSIPFQKGVQSEVCSDLESSCSGGSGSSPIQFSSDDSDFSDSEDLLSSRTENEVLLISIPLDKVPERF